MSDLRKQLKKAGLVSDKQLRQAKHKERVHAKEVGREGIEGERRERERRQQAELEARRQADRQRERERVLLQQEEQASQRLGDLILKGWIREATLGSRRFFFQTAQGRISFLDLSDRIVRRLVAGTAAVVESRGIVRGEHCVVGDRCAAELRVIDPGLICHWNEDAKGSG